MEIIKDKILELGKTYNDCKFIRCYNSGANLIDCIWESGIHGWGTSSKICWKSGIWHSGTFKYGNWKNGLFEHGIFNKGSIWESGIWEKGYREGKWKS